MTLFLDFDGVLHPDPCVAQFKFCQRNLIEGILHEFPQVDIVLSATWRLRYPLDTSGNTLKHHFSSDIAERIVGVTSNHKGLDRNQAPDGIDLYVIRDAGLWDQVREVVIPINIDAITGTITGELAAEECYQSLKARNLGRHHALADALALRAAYVAKAAAHRQR